MEKELSSAQTIFKNNSERVKTFLTKYRVSLIVLFFSMALIVAGFLMPPAGAIDGSVLTAIGEVFTFTAAITGIDTYRQNFLDKLNRNREKEN